MISHLVNKCWFSRFPLCKNIIYNNGSEFQLHFETLCNEYGVKQKPTSINNPQVNAISEQVHQVLMTMVHTSEINMADSVTMHDINAVLKMHHGPITLPIAQYSKPLQVQQYLDCLIYHSQLTEKIGEQAMPDRTENELIMIMMLVVKY